MKIFLIFIALFSFSSASTGQGHFILSSFKATKDKDRVILTWTIKQNFTCQGTGILRSIDGNNFEQIGEIQGICGSSKEPVNYTFVDENPVNNKTNFYVLELGLEGKTDPPLRVDFIDFSAKTSRAVPNPSRGNSTVYFFNPNNEIHTLNLYDNVGRTILTHTTNGDQFIINLEESSGCLQPGHPTEYPGYAPFIATNYYYVILSEAGKKVSSGAIVMIR